MKTMQAEEAIKEKELAERNRHLRGRHREEIRNVQKLRQWQKQEILRLLQSMKLFSKRTDRVRKINRQLRNNGAKVQYESCIDEENKRELMQYLVLIMCRS